MTLYKNKFILVVVLLTISACEKEQAGGGRPADRTAIVVTERVELQAMIDEIQALGTANANESVDIQSRIPSIVERIAFEEGQLVAAGDLLVELENDEIDAGLAVAEATLSESRSLYDRSQNLAESQAISASGLEQLHAQVQVHEAQVLAARARLDNTIIRAPFSGRIGLRRVSPGSFVDTSTVITTLDDVSKIKLDFSVPESFLTVLSDGMNIVAHSLVYPEQQFEGVVQSIDTRLDPISRSIRVRAIVPNSDALLKPGMFLTVDLQRDRGNVLLAPEQAIVPEGSAQFVYVAVDGFVEKRAVILGRRIPGFVVIDEGLSAGDTVVTEGTHKLRDGSAIKVSDPDVAPATT